MENIGNATLQFFSSIVMPILLPVFLLSILIGMRRPEKLMDEVVAVMEAIIMCFVKVIFTLIKAVAKSISMACDRKQAPASAPDRTNGGPYRRKGPGRY